jgi:hypothetical protein
MYLPLYNNLDFFFLDFNLNKKHFKDFKPIKLMVYILELETSQTTAIKILIDTLSSIVSDVKFTFYPYYMEKNTSEEETELMSEQKTTKQIGGLVMKELNKSGSILVYSKLDADKFVHLVKTFNHFNEKIPCTISFLLSVFTSIDNPPFDSDISKSASHISAPLIPKETLLFVHLISIFSVIKLISLQYL